MTLEKILEKLTTRQIKNRAFSLTKLEFFEDLSTVSYWVFAQIFELGSIVEWSNKNKNFLWDKIQCEHKKINEQKEVSEQFETLDQEIEYRAGSSNENVVCLWSLCRELIAERRELIKLLNLFYRKSGEKRTDRPTGDQPWPYNCRGEADLLS